MSQVGGADLGILKKFGTSSAKGDRPKLQQAGSVSQPQGHHSILLDDQKGNPRLIDIPEDCKDLAHEFWCQSHGGLIEQKNLRPAHEGPAEKDLTSMRVGLFIF